MESQCNCTVEWIYENFSNWNIEIHGKCITCAGCPLDLYPRGLNGDGEHLMVTVNDGYESSSVELSFLGSDGPLIHKQEVQNPKWHGYGCVTLPTGPGFEDVVRAMEDKDILILKLYKSADEGRFIQGRTIIDVVDRCIKIPTYTFRDYPNNCNFLIWDFAHRNVHKFYSYELELVANKEDLSFEDSKIHFELSPYLGINTENVFVRTCVSLLDSNGITVKSEENKHLFRDDTDWKFFSISKMKNFEQNGFYLNLHLKFISGDLLHMQSRTYVECIESIPNKQNVPLKDAETMTDSLNDVPSNSPMPVLLQELMCLYQGKDFSDFKLKCGDVSFLVHRAILSARSPVFKTMLSTDMTESVSDSVDIVDLDPSTLARFLAFLYTGKVERETLEDTMEVESALKLYNAADKYQVPTLKKECADFISANVSIENVCVILSLGDKHQDDEIISVAHKFILKNFNEVLSSKAWENLMKIDPFLTSKTVTIFAQKRCLKNV